METAPEHPEVRVHEHDDSPGSSRVRSQGKLDTLSRHTSVSEGNTRMDNRGRGGGGGEVSCKRSGAFREVRRDPELCAVSFFGVRKFGFRVQGLGFRR